MTILLVIDVGEGSFQGGDGPSGDIGSGLDNVNDRNDRFWNGFHWKRRRDDYTRVLVVLVLVVRIPWKKLM